MSRDYLEQCFHECAQRAWRLACVLVGDPHWAADCVQSAFAAAARKPGAVPARNPWPWFSTVLVNEVRNQRRKRRPKPSAEEIDMPDPEPGPASKAQQSETAGELRLALETLPEAEREAITLTFIGGLSRAEAAAALDMPYKTLNSHVARGLERLRARLNHKEETLMSGLAALPLLTPPGGWEGALAAWQGAAVGLAVPGTVAIVGGTIMAKKAMVAAGLVLALLVGFGGGMLVEHSSSAPAPTDRIASASRDGQPTLEGHVDLSSSGAARDARVSDGLEAGGKTHSDSDGRTARASEAAAGGDSPEETRGLLRAWLAALKTDIPTKGEGKIFGTVMHRNGSPIPGAVITLHALRPSSERPGGERSTEDSVHDHAHRLLFQDSNTLKVVTDDSGKFEVTGLPNLQHQVRAKAPGFQCDPAGVRPQGDYYWPDAEVNFVAKPVMEIEIDARLPDGSQPISFDAILKYAGGDDDSIHGGRWWPASTVRKPGNCILTVWAGTYNEFSSDPVPLTFKIGDPPKKVSVALKLRPGILCKVIQPATWGERAQPQLTLIADPPAGPMTYGQWLAAKKVPAGRRNDDWFFGNLSPGRYRAFAIISEQILAVQDVDLGSEFKAIELALRDVDPAGFIVARVFSPDGQLMRELPVWVEVLREGESSGRAGTVYSRSDGSYWIERVSADSPILGGARNWWYMVVARSEDYGEVKLKVPSTATADVDIRYQPVSHLTVTVPGASAHPYKASLRVTMLQRDENGNWAYVYPTAETQWTTGASTDELRFSPIRVGACRFVLSAEPAGIRAQGSLPIAELTFEITKGQQQQICPLPPLFALTVLADDPKSLQWLTVKRVGSGQYEGVTVTGPVGRMTFPGLVAGDWVLASRTGEMRVSVQRDLEVRLDVRPFDCIALGGIKAGGALEASGLRANDRVVQIDGQGYGDADALMKLFEAAMLKEQSTWTIARAGAQVTVQVGGIEISKLKLLEGDARETLSARKAMRE